LTQLVLADKKYASDHTAINDPEDMNTQRARLALTAVLAAVSLLAVGCGILGKSKPAAWTVSITKKTQASIEIDVIGVTESEKPSWAGYNIDKYWAPGDPRRKGADKDKLTQTLEFEKAWRIEKKDSKWSHWFDRGATELLIIANLPGKFEPGPTDPRRMFLPLNKKSWDAKKSTLEIEVQDTLIKVLTRQKPRR
jgi:hypothetical protein